MNLGIHFHCKHERIFRLCVTINLLGFRLTLYLFKNHKLKTLILNSLLSSLFLCCFAINCCNLPQVNVDVLNAERMNRGFRNLVLERCARNQIYVMRHYTIASAHSHYIIALIIIITTIDYVMLTAYNSFVHKHCIISINFVYSFVLHLILTKCFWPIWIHFWRKLLEKKF